MKIQEGEQSSILNPYNSPDNVILNTSEEEKKRSEYEFII